MTPQTAPKDVIKIFNRKGNELVQFKANVSRSWIIGAEGRAAMTLATRKTDYVDPDIIRPGNWLYIQNDTLPDWVGVIDLPRQWSARTVTVNAFTPERVFSWRRGPLEQKITGSAGAIAEELLRLVNVPEITILRPGNIWKGGSQREETLHPNPLSQNLMGLQARSLEEYSWRADYTGNSLVVYLDWAERIGNPTQCSLVEGKSGGNIENGGLLIEDGVIINNVLGYGKGATWPSRPNDETNAIDTSRVDYGLMQSGKDWGNVTVHDTIIKNNNTFLRNSSQPHKSFSVTALNRGDTFSFMDLGNRMPLQMQSVGFVNGGVGVDTDIRIMGMSYDPSQGHKVQLVLREIL